MGLGPPVCLRCKVIYKFKHSYGWECPVCKKNDDQRASLWDCGIDEEELEGNLRFLLFMQGKNPDKDEEET